MAANKVKFGLKNVHYAIATESTVGGVTTTSYGTPVAWNGAVNLEVNPSSTDQTVFRADDSDYYIVSGSSQGFDGTYECAYVPEDVETDVLGMTKDNNGVIIDKSSDTVAYVALMFEINGDNSGRRYLVPKVKFAKPGISAETTGTDGNQPKTVSLSFTASPRPDDNMARLHTGDTTDATTYNNWFNAVYTPSIGSYTVTYNVNGGTGSVDPETVTAGSSITVDDGSDITAPAGKTFAGWALTDDAVSPTILGGASYTPTADVTLYAVYTE